MRRGFLGILLPCLLSSLSIVGCGDDDRGDSAESVPLDEVPSRIAEVFCASVSRCFGALAEVLPQDNCEQNLENQYRNTDFAALERAVEAGTVEYDAIKTSACLDAFTDLGCELFSERSPAVCEEAIAGSAALGEPCSIDAECEGRAFCDTIENACPGACAALRARGASCERDSECEDGLTCTDRTCQPVASEGQACGGEDGVNCRLGSYCLGSTGTEAGTCATAATLLSRREGESCALAEQRLCEPGLSCVLQGITDGEARFECEPPVGSGEPCSLGFPEPCPADHYCDAEADATTAAGTCVPLPGAGEPCVAGRDRVARCTSGLACVDDECASPRENGQPCTSPAQCFSERCVDGLCTGVEFCTE